MSNKIIQIKRTSTALSSPLKLNPGEFAITRRKLYLGPKTDSNAIGSETTVTPMRILTEDDYTALANIAQGKTTAYVTATTPASLTSGSFTDVNNKTIALSSLKIGDYVLVTATETPDYFWTGSALAPIEIDKSLLNGYATEEYVSGQLQSYATTTSVNNTLKNYVTTTTLITKLVGYATIDSVESKVESATATLRGVIDSELTTLEDDINKKFINTNKSITNLDTIVTRHTSEITALETKDTEIINRIDAISQDMSDPTQGLSPRLTALEDTVTDTSTGLVKKVASLSSSYHALATDVTDLHSDLHQSPAGAFPRIEELENTVEGIQADVEGLINAIDCGAWTA